MDFKKNLRSFVVMDWENKVGEEPTNMWKAKSIKMSKTLSVSKFIILRFNVSLSLTKMF